MFSVYKEEGKTLIKNVYQDTDEFELESGSWIHISNPTQENIQKIAKLTGIAPSMLLCSLDDEESARIDVDDGDTLIVLDTPYIEENEDLSDPSYSTIPFIIAYNRSFYVTICKKDTALIDELFKRVKLVEPHKHVRLTLNFIYRLASTFIVYLRKINAHTEVIEVKLRSAQKNKELLELMDLNKTLVYFSTALNSNKGVLSRLLKSQTYKKFEDDFDLMEDTVVEMDQAIEMCSIYRDILANLMDAFASVINNNMNVTMKTLSLVTIIISIPTLISSIFGMNVLDMPLAEHKYGFWIVIGLSLGLTIIGAIILILVFNKNINRKK